MKSTVLTLFIIPFILGVTNLTEKDTVADSKKVVLELFTSQGCSSCPPADRLLKEVKSDDVIVLSYHVDYWNYIGWKDPFSTAEFTEKQRKYGSKFYSSTIYTPQVVVNGKEHFVGSDATKLKRKITSYSKGTSNEKINILSPKIEDNYITFNYNFEGEVTNENLRVVLVINERKTSVKRGENRNRELVNNNIVVAEQQFKVKDTKGNGRLKLPDVVNNNDDLSLVLILQNDNLDIITAAQSKL